MSKKAAESGSRPRRDPALAPLPNAEAYRERADLWRQQGEYQRALADYQKAIKRAPNHPEGYRGRAWIWATCPDEHLRNGADAVQDAVRAQRLAGPVPEVVVDNLTGEVCMDTEFYTTLAVAQAEAGDFQEAIDAIQQGLSFATAQAQKDRMLAFLTLFKAKRPYREPRGAKGPTPADILAGVPGSDQADEPVAERKLSVKSAEEKALLAAIVDKWDDDAPRRVYADWLEEHGQPGRAEFIRISCEMSKVWESGPRYQELLKRSRGVRDDHEDEWLGPLKALGLCIKAQRCSPVTYDRGLIESVLIDVEGVVPGRLDELFEAAPELQGLSFDCPADGAALAASPYLERLTYLHLSSELIDLAGMRAILASPRLRHLRKLFLFHMGNEVIEALAASDNMLSLSTLLLCWCKVDPAVFGALASSSRLAGLRNLAMENMDLRPEAIEALAIPSVSEGPRATKNRVLLPQMPDLTCLSLNYNSIGPKGGAINLVQYLGEKRLQVLQLSFNEIKADGARALAESANLAQLTSLELNYNGIGTAGATALAASPHLKRLTKLNLSDNRLGPPAVQALASSASLACLKELLLFDNPIGVEGAVALAESPYLKNLERLGVSARKVKSQGEKLLKTRFKEAICFD